MITRRGAKPSLPSLRTPCLCESLILNLATRGELP